MLGGGALGIVGVGLIGGSIGLAAKRQAIASRVLGFGRSRASLEEALALQAIDEATESLAELARRCDLIVLCTPVDRIAGQALELAPHCRPGTLLTDAGSTKERIVAALDSQLPAGVAFVGAHPLAGSEKKGPLAARADLFVGRVVVLTPNSRTPAAAVERVADFWKSLGARIEILDPATHDRALAVTSHLPHLVASALAGLLPITWQSLTAGGFRDTTRIASADPELWSAIFRDNRSAVLAALAEFQQRLDAYRQAIETHDFIHLTELLTQAKKVRDALGSGDSIGRP